MAASEPRVARVAVWPGDGIGVEVTAEAVRCLERAMELVGAARLELETMPWGVEWHARHGQVAPDDLLERLVDRDAILLGAVGWPARLPDHVTLAPLIRVRQSFDQFACVRPARLLPGVLSPLRDKGPEDIDFVVVRENSEGEYVDSGGRVHRGRRHELAVQTSIHTRRGVERIVRFSLELARTRRRKLTLVTKSNAQRHAFVLWEDVLAELAGEFPDVSTERQHVDAAAMNLVRRPESFDVLVASNLFGDILTDLGAVVAGGLGLAPSANLNPERRFPSLFEPVHGSAPDIAGTGVANPVAAILSAAMLLDWIEEPRAARLVRGAVERALAEGHRTPDLGGALSCRELGDRIVERLEG